MSGHPTHSVALREIVLFGRSAQCALKIEAWPDGVHVVRVAGCSVYGEGQTIDAAVLDLIDNIDEFIEDVQPIVANGDSLGGVVKRDWTLLSGLFGVDGKGSEGP